MIYAVASIFSAVLWCQTVPAPTVAAQLPSTAVGAGTSWQRGATYPASGDFTFAQRIGASNWYSWTTGSTPVATVPKGSAPLATTFTTGGAWIAAQSTSGFVALLTIVQVGFSTVQATSTTAPVFSGSLALAIRPWASKRVWIVPYARIANPAAGTGGALASGILQPGLQVVYGFGGK